MRRAVSVEKQSQVTGKRGCLCLVDCEGSTKHKWLLEFDGVVGADSTGRVNRRASVAEQGFEVKKNIAIQRFKKEIWDD